MSIVLVAIGGFLLAAPWLTVGWLRRLPPRDWADLVTASLVGGIGVVEVGFVTLAAPTVLNTLGWSGLARACERMFRSLAIGGPVVGWLAAVAAVAIAVTVGAAALRAARLQRRARVEPWLGEHEQYDDDELVMLPTPEPVAYSVGGRRAQVVISVGMVHALTPEQLAAVIRHERSHLRHRHQGRLVLAAGIDGALGRVPGVRASTATLRTALERWADEDSSGVEREARECLRAALLATARAVAPELAAFGGAHTTIERATALARPAPAPSTVGRALGWAALISVWLVGVSALGLWIGRTRSVLAMAGYCPS